MRRILELLLVGVLLLLSGCAGHRAFQAGEEFSRQGNHEQAFLRYAEAVNASPGRHEYRLRLQDARAKAALLHLEAGRRLLGQGNSRGAQAQFSQALALDPSNQTAAQELRSVQAILRAEELATQAEQRLNERKFGQAKSLLEEAMQLHPEQAKARDLLTQVREREHRTVVDGMELDVASDKPITLKFKDADIRDVFTILTRLSGINFIFDEDIRAQRVTVLLEQGTFAQALQLLLGMNNLEKKILNAKTIVIYPNTKEKDKKFEDHLIQTFYLSNIDAKKAVNMLRTMLQLRKIYVHEELNALIIRDTPATVRLAQQILEAADRSDSEVVYELELIEVGHTNSLDLGTKIVGTPNSISFGLGKPGAETIGTVVTSGLSRLDFLYQVPSATFTFERALSDTELLANPKIRVKNKEKAKVHIGSREPIITNTLTASGDVTSTNVQYVDVGIKLDIEPNIQLDSSIVTKLNLEVSSVSERKTISGGGEALTITTTNAQTSLILKDGEQTVIGGLIRDDFTKRRESIPLLGDIPLLGSLISGHERDKTKREILLSITPHIVKKVEMPTAAVATIWSGGEDDLQTGPRFGAFSSVLEAESKQEPPPPVPADTTAAFRRAKRAGSPVKSPPDQEPSTERGGAAQAATPAPLPETAPVVPAPLREGEEIDGSTPVEQPSAAPEASVQPAAADPLVFFAGPVETLVGSEIALEVRVAGMQSLHSAPLFVSYPSDRLELVRAEEGTFLRGDGGNTVFSTAGNPNTGELIIGHKQEAGRPGASGEGNLFRLVFRGRASGTAVVALDKINFRDPAGNRIDVAGTEMLVNVRQP